MDSSITTALTIMMINMTIVFFILIALSFLIRLIHIVDPTAKKEEPKKETPAVTTPPPVATQPAAPIIEEGVPEEVIAVIFAAIAGYGYSAGQVHAIRPTYNKVWEHSGRYQGGQY